MKLLGGPNGVLWSQCDVPTHHRVLHMMLKGIFVDRCFTNNGTLEFEFLHEFSGNFKPNWQGMVQISFATWDCAPLCQILCHFNNARLINVPQVANWG